MTGNAMGGDPWRILTDLSSGPFDTVVLEAQMESLAAWERFGGQLFAAPRFRASIAQTQPLLESGRTELSTIEAQGGP